MIRCPPRLWQQLCQAWDSRNPVAGLLTVAFEALRNLTARGNAPLHEPTCQRQRLPEELVNCYQRLDEPSRRCLRQLLSLALQRPDQPPFETALHVAGQIPLPEARNALLQLLADRRVADPQPPAAPSAGPDPADHSSNYQRWAAVIRALGRLREPGLASLFSRLLTKYAGQAQWNRHLQPVVHQAGWALCLARPDSLPNVLPTALQVDPLFLADLLAEDDPQLTHAVNSLLGQLPGARRALLQEQLTRRSLVRPPRPSQLRHTRRPRRASKRSAATASSTDQALPSRSATAARPECQSGRSARPGPSR